MLFSGFLCSVHSESLLPESEIKGKKIKPFDYLLYQIAHNIAQACTLQTTVIVYLELRSEH